MIKEQRGLIMLIELGTSQGVNLGMFNISNRKETLISMAIGHRIKEDQNMHLAILKEG